MRNSSATVLLSMYRIIVLLSCLTFSTPQVPGRVGDTAVVLADVSVFKSLPLLSVCRYSASCFRGRAPTGGSRGVFLVWHRRITSGSRRRRPTCGPAGWCRDKDEMRDEAVPGRSGLCRLVWAGALSFGSLQRGVP